MSQCDTTALIDIKTIVTQSFELKNNTLLFLTSVCTKLYVYKPIHSAVSFKVSNVHINVNLVNNSLNLNQI